MEKNTKLAGIGLVLSSVAMLLAGISTLVGGGQSAGLFGGMTAVFCANLAIYAAQKKKGRPAAPKDDTDERP